MAYLDENATWEQGIYQWETQDPVVGGPDGIDNVPTRQLANRTGYLKEQIAAHAAATDPHPQYMTESEVHALVEVTQPQFDSTQKPASTEFVQRSLGNFQGVLQVTTSGTTTLTPANVGQFIDIFSAGAVVVGLPQSISCPLGATLLITNYASQSVTVNPYSGDSINNTVSLGSVTIAINGTGQFVNQGGGMWRLAGGDALLPSSGVMSGANWVTPAQFDNSTRLATTSFVQRALGNLSDAVAITTSGALSSKDVGKIVLFGGSASQTLSMPSGIRAGTSYYLYNWSPAAWTLTTSSGVFNGPGATGTNSLVIPAGTFACIVFDSTNWVATYSPYAALPSQFDASNRQATTGFVQRALGNLSAVTGLSAGTTLSASAWGQLFVLNSSTAQTITVPGPETAGSTGATIRFCNWGGGTFTLTIPATSGGVFITPTGIAKSISMPPGEWMSITTDGVNYFADPSLKAQLDTHAQASDPHPQYFLRTDAATVSATLKSTTDALNQHVASANHFATGTRLMFAQAAAPTGWVQITSDLADNRMLRVVKTAGAGTGGSHSPILNNVVPAHTHGFSTGGQSADHSHSGWTGGQSADHSHGYDTLLRLSDTDRGGNSSEWSIDNVSSYSTGGVSGDHGHYITTGGVSSNHTHAGSTDNGSSQTNWTPRYIDLILCERQ
jgi:hypothetical protein